MSEHFDKVKTYLAELGFFPDYEDESSQLFIINDEERGINKMVIDVEEPILVFEQFLVDLDDNTSAATLKKIMQLNRTLVHGSFALDESGNKLLYRDTLQLENLDLNEIEASINALSLALAENAGFILSIRKLEEV
jgi:hypothetical protein